MSQHKEGSGIGHGVVGPRVPQGSVLVVVVVLSPTRTTVVVVTVHGWVTSVAASVFKLAFGSRGVAGSTKKGPGER